MSMQFEVGAGGSTVPEGFYKAKFVAIDPTEHEEYGPGSKWIFQVVDGEHSGEQATRLTSPTPTPKNACGRMIAGVLGESLKVGAKVDLESYVGREYLLQVEPAPKGEGTRIAAVMPNWKDNGDGGSTNA